MHQFWRYYWRLRDLLYTYTPSGQIERIQGSASPHLLYEYDSQGQPSTIVYSDATPSVTYHYHRDGSLREATSGTYRHVYTYDARLRPQREDIHAHGHHALLRGYATAAPGRYESFELRPGSGGSGTALSRSAYRYDPAGRIDRITSPLYPPPPEPPALPEPPLPHVPVDAAFTYGYLAQSDLIERITGPAHLVTQTFQPRGEAVSARTHSVGSTTVSRYAYRADQLGRREASTWSGDAFAEPRRLAYRYDALGHLTDVEPSSGADLATPGDPVPTDTFAFAYDELGNRLTARRGTYAESYTTNLLNQYTGVAVSGAGPPPLPMVRTFEHDPDGNLLRDERWTYTWDAENRLVRQQTRSGLTPALRLDYTYDHQGRRVTKHVFTLDAVGAPAGARSATLFRYDGWRIIAELDLLAPSEPRLLRTYTWGLDLSGTLYGAGGIGGLLAVTTHGDTPATAYPTYDGAGNITQWLDASGNELAHTEYGPFGEILRQRGQAPAPLGYSTKYTDAETGLLCFGYRYYDPRDGRWLNRDPLEEQGGLNLYGFNENDPLNQIDPLGQSPISIAAKAVVKLGIKKGIKDYIENRLKREILGAIQDKAYKKAAKELADEALTVMDTLSSEWWELAIEFVPVAGDVYGGTKFALKLREVNRRLEDIERRAGDLVKKATEKTRKAALAASERAAKAGGGGKPPRPPKKVAGGFDDDAAERTASAIPESYMNPRHLVNMEPARDLVGSTLNASGEVRNKDFFWRQLIEREPQMFSKGNLYKIQELGLAPKVDATWVKFNPTHQSFMKQSLHHHHINKGPVAVPLPQTVHEKWTSVLHGN